MTKFLLLVSATSSIFIVRVIASVIFVAVQWVVLRAFLRILRSMGFSERREKLAVTLALAPVDLSRRRFMQMMLLAAASMPFAISAYGAVAARSRKVVERVVIPIKGLPPPLDGFTIVQMSDIHAGFFMNESTMREYVEIANGLEPDIVALTGDFVATDQNEVEPFMRAMTGLRTRRGVFGCLGNHDMFTGSEEEFERQFRAAGFKVLRSENELIDIKGA